MFINGNVIERDKSFIIYYKEDLDMIKIFVTGDNHIGKKYDKYVGIKDKLIESRFKSFEAMVKKAEVEGCGIFAITGDLFDNVNNIKVGDVKKIVEILSGFSGSVLVLPGNHDFYTGDEKVWKDFEKALSDIDHNITILNEFKTYDIEIGDEKVTIYPAFCQSKHSNANNLGWIKDSSIDVEGCYNIGIAHGAIKGLSPDMKEEYFLMTENELNVIPVDAWLIGHTHISYPKLENSDVGDGYKIFNPGTHEQTDLANNTEGVCFILTIDKKDGIATTNVRKVVSGGVRYYDLKLKVSPDSDLELHNGIEGLVADFDKNSIIRIKISGSVKEAEYDNRSSIYEKLLKGFLVYTVDDTELSVEISLDRIKKEYSEISIVAKLMEELSGNPVELQMVYELMKKCNE